jgi:hypothetical protein
MTPVLVTSALLVGALVLCVVATMVVENWSRWRVRVRSGARRVPTSAAIEATRSGPEPLEPDLAAALAELDDPTNVAMASAAPGAEGLGVGFSAPDDLSGLDLSDLDLSGLDLSGIDLADSTTPVRPEVLHVFTGRERADQVVGALFAAYAAARLPEAGRASAWVTAVARPEGVEGKEFEPGTSLRGKPAAAGRLLECNRDGRVWVTLNPSVDIAIGVSRRPPSCVTLAGLVALWAATRAAVSLLADDGAVAIAAAITELEPQWRGTTSGPEVLSLLVALSEAIDRDAAVRLQVMLGAVGGTEPLDRDLRRRSSTSGATRTV